MSDKLAYYLPHWKDLRLVSDIANWIAKGKGKHYFSRKLKIT